MSEVTDCDICHKKKVGDPILFAGIDPLNIEDRARAVREVFTSVARDCPFYNEGVRSKCVIDPHVIFIPECSGRSFANGICCPKIIQSSFDKQIGTH